jgi:hypothetical protein
MHFTIDQKPIAVVIAGRPLIKNGQPARAMFDPATDRVLISDQLPRGERERALFHELRHAWIHAHGFSTDAEIDADQSAEMMLTLMRQYAAQGGAELLERLEPEVPETAQRGMGGSMLLAMPRCGNCDAPAAPGSVATSRPEWQADFGMFIVQRGLLCEVCDRVSTWAEIANGEGWPLGTILHFPQPRVLAGVDATAWIRANPETCRVKMLD